MLGLKGGSLFCRTRFFGVSPLVVAENIIIFDDLTVCPAATQVIKLLYFQLPPGLRSYLESKNLLIVRKKTLPHFRPNPLYRV